MSYLSPEFGGDRGLIKQVRNYRIIYNSIDDGITLDRHATNIAQEPDSCYYKEGQVPIVPTGEFAREANLTYGGEPVVLNRDQARLGHHTQQQGTISKFGITDSRVPVSSTLNGASGQCVADIQNQYKFVGIAELPGRDTGAKGLTSIAAGLLTVHNALGAHIQAGDLIQCVPPTLAEAKGLKPAQGNGANGKGRIHWVLKTYNPSNYDFYAAERSRRILCEYVIQVDAAGLFSLRDILSKPESTAMDLASAQSLKALVHTLADVVVLAGGANPQDAAIRYLLLSGRPEYGAGGRGNVSKFLDDLKHDPHGGKPAAIQRLQNDHPNALFKEQGIQRYLWASANLRKVAEESVVGVAVTGAKPGKYFDMHFRSYNT